MLTFVLYGLAFGANATQSAQGKSDTAQKESQDTMTVLSSRVEREAGTKTTLTANYLLKESGNTFSFCNLMRYQPLVSTPGVSAGATAGKSSHDRGGYSGYNIRGLENKATKELRNHRVSYGVNIRQSESERPLTAQNIVADGLPIQLSRPQADSKIINAGTFMQDKMTWDVAGRDFSVIPAVRFAWQHAKPENTDNLFAKTNGNVMANNTWQRNGK
ncbi:MAG: hypothetical protein ACR5LF_12055 [Symbiopectobacterium sp.]